LAISIKPPPISAKPTTAAMTMINTLDEDALPAGAGG
jgi:hypothetical protein